MVVEVKSIGNCGSDRSGVDVTGDCHRGVVPLQLGVEDQGELMGEIEAKPHSWGKHIRGVPNVDEGVLRIRHGHDVVDASAPKQDIRVGMEATKGRAESETGEQVPLCIDGTIIDGERAAYLDGRVEAETTLQGNVGSGGQSKVSSTSEPCLNARAACEDGDLRTRRGGWQRLSAKPPCQRGED